MLLAETGRPLIEHTYRAALRSRLAQEVIVATDDRSIADVIARCGGMAVMTAPELASGTERVAAVASQRADMDLWVNLQGDEPEMSGESIDAAIRTLIDHKSAVMATIAAPLRDPERLADPSCVKVVLGAQGQALYFSRAAIPHARQGIGQWLDAEPPVYFQHMGLYVYRRDFLLEFTRLAPSPLETVESLEQLRVLSAGYSIQVALVPCATGGIDTPQDYAAFVSRQRN
jgi:3-deoxy-manno-octulosonate cytidylyltransferase (CMP-KDO synthetase)